MNETCFYCQCECDDQVHYVSFYVSDEEHEKVKSKLLCKFPFDRQHGPDDLTYGR
jgi:hypothetical protein